MSAVSIAIAAYAAIAAVTALLCFALNKERVASWYADLVLGAVWPLTWMIVLVTTIVLAVRGPRSL